MSELHSKMLVEQRFPVRLGQQVATLESAYRKEKQANWNPVSDIPWDQLEAGSLSEQDRKAARLMWSRRLWAAYGYLSETPATLIRLCLERGRPISPKFFLTVRNTQEACHIDVMQQAAEAYGGYLPKPSKPAYAAILNVDLAQRVLHADTPIDAYILAHCAIKIGAEAALYRSHGAGVRNPAIAAILARIAEDKERHAAFGWDFVLDRADNWVAGDRAAAKDAVIDALNIVVFSGYLTPFLAAPGVAEEEKAAEAHIAAAGLGAAAEPQQRRAVSDYMAAIRKQLARLSITLPETTGA